MLTLTQMLLRLGVALALGALVGLERELVRKEAGIRTLMLISGGAAMFTLVGITLPYLVAMPDAVSDTIVNNSGFLMIIANVVMGAGFIGAGIIIKTQEHVHGLTTATMVWVTAAIGILAGLGATEFAVAASLIITILLYLLRKLNVSENVGSFKFK